MLFDSPRQRQLRKRKKIRQSLWVERPLDRRRSSSVSAFQEEIAKLKNEFAATDGGGGGGDDNNDDDDDDDDDNNQSRSRSNANRTGRDRHNSDTAAAEEPRAKPHADDIRDSDSPVLENPHILINRDMPGWRELPLWGDVVQNPRSRAVPLNHHKTPRKKNRADVGGRYRLGGNPETPLGILKLRIGLVHLCTVDLDHGLSDNCLKDPRRRCREYFHYDGIRVGETNSLERTFTLTVEFEGIIHKKVRMSRPDMLAWEHEFNFEVTNFRSEVIVTVHAAWQEDLEEACYVGQASFNVLSQIECQNNANMVLDEEFCEYPIKQFHDFFYEAPKARLFDENHPEHSKCQEWHKNLLWHDLRGDKGMLVGRIGLDAHFDASQRRHFMQCISHGQGHWEESKNAVAEYGRYTWTGDGVPERQPDFSNTGNHHTFQDVKESITHLYQYMVRIYNILQYLAAFLNRMASILTWEDFYRSLRWFIGSTVWAYFFRLEHIPIHVSFFLLWGLYQNYQDRQRGVFYISKLTPDLLNRNRVQLKCAKLLIGVLEATIHDSAYHKLSIKVFFNPGEKDNMQYKIGTVEETDHLQHRIQHNAKGLAKQVTHGAATVTQSEWLLRDEDVNNDSVHEFTATGRRYNAFKRLSEVLGCSSYAPGSVLENRTMLWQPTAEDLEASRKNSRKPSKDDKAGETRKAAAGEAFSWKEEDGTATNPLKLCESGGTNHSTATDRETSGAGYNTFDEDEGEAKDDDPAMEVHHRHSYIPQAPMQPQPVPPPIEHADSGSNGEAPSKDVIESLEYSILQSSKLARNRHVALPWKEHQGKLHFEVVQQSAFRHETIGVVDVNIKDLVDKKKEKEEPMGAQKIRRKEYDIRKAFSQDKIGGELKLQLQLILPPGSEFREIDRLRQFELESVMRPSRAGSNYFRKFFEG
jgi:hypothetical protein